MNSFVNPCIFGPNIWSTIDCLIAPLPEVLNLSQSTSIQQFYSSLKILMPCNTCLTSYNNFIKESDTNLDNIDNFKTRTSVILFNYTLRTKVNNKLGKYYIMNLNYYTLKLNLYKCTPTNSYDIQMSKLKECSFIPEKYLDACEKYINSNKNKIKDYENSFTRKLIQKCQLYILNISESNFNDKNSSFKLWINRNKKCYKYQLLLYEYQTKTNCDINNLFEEQKDIVSNLLYWGGFPFSTFEISKINFLKNI
jgi:hypothetical protein